MKEPVPDCVPEQTRPMLGCYFSLTEKETEKMCKHVTPTDEVRRVSVSRGRGHFLTDTVKQPIGAQRAWSV